MKQLVIFVLSCLLIIGCTNAPKQINQTNSKLVFNQKDSLISFNDTLLDKQITSLIKEVTKSGAIEKKYFINGTNKLHGLFKEYYPNGQVKKEGFYINGEKFMHHFEYYPDGKKYIQEIFMPLGNDSSFLFYPGQVLYYDTTESIIKEASKYTNVSIDNDTIKLGKAINIKFEFIGFNSFEWAQLYFGNSHSEIDSYFRVADSSKVYKQSIKDNNCTISFTPKKLGFQTYYGKLIQHHKDSNSSFEEYRLFETNFYVEK